MHQVVIFDTESEAETQQAIDLVSHLANHTDETYNSQTTRWAIPRLRLDGKWDYDTCEHSDYTGLTLQNYNQADYAKDEHS